MCTPNRDADHRLLRGGDEDGLPVLVWIHGGGLTEEAGRNYDGSKLAANGTVVVTINYRLGALGFLAHPALASRPGGPADNYGLMGQQAALRWVRAGRACTPGRTTREVTRERRRRDSGAPGVA